MADSYWSKRRRIEANVALHLADIAAENSGTATFVNSDHPTEMNDDYVKLQTCVTPELNSCTVESVLQCPHNICEQMPDMFSPDTNCDSDSASAFFVSDSSDAQSDVESDSDPTDEMLLTGIAKWALEFNVTQTALGSLLALLRPHHPILPKDPRTLLATPRAVVVRKLDAGGMYHHVGLSKCIEKLHQNRLFDLTEIAGNPLLVQINIDGVPLYKSSGLQLWPILGMLKYPPISEVFTVGVYAGSTKPANVCDYLKEFVDEAYSLEKDGLLLSNTRCLVKFHSFVCDAPARSFIKSTKSFSGYYGCDRCVQAGKYHGRMTFPELSAILRTDKGFSEMMYEDHHLNSVPCPLVILSVGLVSDFVLDYMHLVCLGVMRRLLLQWLRGPLITRLHSQKVSAISQHLVQLRQYIPSDFSRKPRSLTDIDRWKATELRQFLLFTGPLVLHDILPEALYKHFQLLHVAISCLVSRRFSLKMCDYAQKLLVEFVRHAVKLYGDEFIVYNVHCLIHLTDDVRRFGPLDQISAFPFENHLRKLKRVIRKSSLPLQQVVNRICERQHLSISDQGTYTYPYVKGLVSDINPVTGFEGAVHYATVHCDKHNRLSAAVGNNCVMLEDGTVGLVHHILQQDSDILVALFVYKHTASFYDYPLHSEVINILKVRNLSNELCVRRLTDVSTKCMCLPVSQSESLIIPLHN